MVSVSRDFKRLVWLFNCMRSRTLFSADLAFNYQKAVPTLLNGELTPVVFDLNMYCFFFSQKKKKSVVV